MSAENKGEGRNSNEVYQQLVDFAEESRFGTVRFKAITDCVSLDILYGELGECQKRLEGVSRNDPKVLMSPDASLLRLTEQRIAHLEHDISQHKSSVKGYENSYSLSLDKLNTLAGVLEHDGGSEEYNKRLVEIDDILHSKAIASK